MTTGPGYPPKLTPDVQKRICDLVRTGNYRETACAAVGIASRTLRVWLRKASEAEAKADAGQELTEADKRHLEFAEALDAAEAEGEARDVMLIGKAASLDWKAAAWRLERRGSKRWGYKQQIEHSGSIGSAPTSQEQAAAARRLMDSEFGRVAPPDEGTDVETRPTEPSGDEDSTES